MALRNIIPDQISSTGALIDQFQYFGLASAFREVDVSGRVDFGYFHPINVVLDGEFVDNTAFTAPPPAPSPSTIAAAPPTVRSAPSPAAISAG